MVTKRYNDIATELPAVLNVLQLFDGYMQVPHVAHLTQRVHKLKEKLSVQVSADLQAAFQVILTFRLIIYSPHLERTNECKSCRHVQSCSYIGRQN
jgi:hypothetical protein